MRKIIIGLAAFLIVVIGAWWFGHTNTAVQPVSAEPVKIGVALYPGFGAFYVAEEKKFFENLGIEVEIKQLSPDAMLPALASNQVQMLVGSADTMALVADVGISAKQIFSTSLSYGADGLVADDSIKTVSDLKGETVYLTYGFPGHFFLRYVASQAGLSAADIKLINLNAEDVGASFVAGKIKTGVTWEPWLSKAQERKNGRVLINSRNSPGVITDIVMARNDLVVNRREDVKKIMRGFFAAQAWWENNIDEGNKIVAKNFNISAVDLAPMKDTVKLMDLALSKDKFNKNKPLNVYELSELAVDFYFTDGIIKIKANGEDMTDPSLLEELL